MKRVLSLLLLILAYLNVAFAQKVCTSNPTTIPSDINFGSITWTASGGATVAECNDMADGVSTFTRNVIVDVANNTKITITNDVTITGNFPISGGPGSVLSVNGGFTLHVTGDLGDAANNGVQYEVVTSNDHIIADGTLYGKNNNAFTGSGTISGGTLDVKNGSTCGSPCPVSGGFSNCTSGDSFCTNNAVPIILLYFDAEILKESIELKWATTMEENFQKFIIQRSEKGIEFQDIGEVTGLGRNIYDIVTKYSFEDKNPLLGFNYYRLKAVDMDETFEIFDVIVTTLSGSKKLYAYPNPSLGESISFAMNFNPSENDYVMVLDPLGSELVRLRVLDTKNQINFQPKLSAGIYTLKYVSSNFEKVALLVVHE